MDDKLTTSTFQLFRDEIIEECAKEAEDRATCVTVGASKIYWNGRDDAAALIRALKNAAPQAVASGEEITWCADGKPCSNKTTGRCWGRCLKEAISAPSARGAINEAGESFPGQVEIAEALASACKDIPPEFAQMVDREFWNLLMPSPSTRSDIK